jgi:hypothetical protein
MTRINTFRKIAESRSSPFRGDLENIWSYFSPLVFAAVLIICSVTVGCSSEKPKPVPSNNQIPVTQAENPVAPMPAPVQALTKPAPRKVVRKKPATVSYTDQTYGVAFEYSRRYAIETGNAAADLLAGTSVPMNFVQPGGVALAAVELPQTGFANTDFSSAFFNVSVNKTLTADQCNEFAVPQPKVAAAAAAPAAAASTPAASAASLEAQPAAGSEPASAAKASRDPVPASSAEVAPSPRLLLGDLELRTTEAVSSEGARQSDSKYFHAYQNRVCYEFALNVITVASEDNLVKHVDRDKVFNRLEQILSTVKITPVAPEAAAEASTAPAATPAQ